MEGKSDGVDIDVRRLRLQPGDRLSVSLPAGIKPEQAQRIKTTIERWAGDVPVLLHPKEIDITVIGHQ
jgi:hypothetical protein